MVTTFEHGQATALRWLTEGLSGPVSLAANGRAFELRLRTLATGEVFDGRHRYERALSLGRGVAQVLVHDQDADRHTCLSLIDLHAFTSQRALSQAVAEARACAAVWHPNVVPVGLAAVCERLGVFYQEVDPGWEYAEGQRLRSMPVSECPPTSQAEAVRFARDAARGLSAAHMRGVFHLALTPAALRVRPVTRRVQVQGFGCRATLARIRIRRACGGAGERNGHWSGPSVEELDYLAPELLPELESVATDHTAVRPEQVDVYGVAAVQHDLLTGQPPLGRSETLAEQRERLLARVRSGGPLSARAQRPGRRPARGARAGQRAYGRVPRRLWRVLERALSVEPGRRHESCEALANDLDAYLQAEPAATDLDRPLTRAHLFWLRTATERASAVRVMALVTLLSLAIVSLFEMRQAHRALSEKRQELQQATQFDGGP